MQKQLKGKIVSVKMATTVVVAVDRLLRHRLYKKILKKTKRYLAHVEKDHKFAVGDIVFIEGTKPLSKNKHFKVVKKDVTT